MLYILFHCLCRAQEFSHVAMVLTIEQEDSLSPKELLRVETAKTIRYGFDVFYPNNKSRSALIFRAPDMEFRATPTILLSLRRVLLQQLVDHEDCDMHPMVKAALIERLSCNACVTSLMTHVIHRYVRNTSTSIVLVK